MLASISPVGEASRRSRWPITVTWYVVGSVLGGVTIGGALGATGELLSRAGVLGPTLAGLLLAGVAVAGLIADARRGVPSLRRQVNERWLTTYRGWVYGLGFGFQLGGGLFTTVTASATYVVLLGSLATGDWRAGALIGGWFGLVRSLPLVATARIRTAAALRGLHQRIDDHTTTVARATAVTQAGVVLGAALLGTGVLA